MQSQLSTDGIVTNMLLTIVWPCSALRNIFNMKLLLMITNFLNFIFKNEMDFKLLMMILIFIWRLKNGEMHR